MTDLAKNDSSYSGKSRESSSSTKVEDTEESYPLTKMVKDFFPTFGMLISAFYAGQFSFSVAWLLLFTILHLLRRRVKKSRDCQKEIRLCLDVDEKAFIAKVADLPSWVYFPEVEKAEWLNKMIKQIWPFVNRYVERLLRDSVEESIRSSLPGPLKSFKFDRIDLGDIAPRVGGVKVYSENTKENEIVLDAELFYAGDAMIKVSFGKMSAGIQNLWIHGDVRIVFSPLIGKVPLIGAMQIYFLESPAIDFNLTNLANALDLPGLNDSLRNVITGTVDSMLVLPNKISFSLTNDVDVSSVRYQIPSGVIRVYVIEARDLMKMDSGLGGSSDPYATIRVGSSKYSTRAVSNSTNPVWSEWFEFVLDTEPSGRRVEIELFDKDTDKDDELGVASVLMENVLAANCNMEAWLPLENAKTGSVHVKVQWMKSSSSPDDLLKAEMSTRKLLSVCPGKTNDSLHSSLVCVKMDSAKDLPNYAKSGEPSPYAVTTVAEHRSETSPCVGTCSPKWAKRQVFLLNDPTAKSVNVQILDKKNLRRPLGSLNYSLQQILPFPMLETMQHFPLEESRSESEIYLGIQLAALINPCETTTGVSKLPETLISKTDRNVESSETELRRRVVAPSAQTSKENSDFGKIQLTMRYSETRQSLVIVVHRCVNIRAENEKKLPDPYVKLSLMKGKSRTKKESTEKMEDNPNPIFDETFEFKLNEKDLPDHTLLLEVKHHHSAIRESTPLGSVTIHLDDIIQNQTAALWFDFEDPRKV